MILLKNTWRKGIIFQLPLLSKGRYSPGFTIFCSFSLPMRPGPYAVKQSPCQINTQGKEISIKMSCNSCPHKGGLHYAHSCRDAKTWCQNALKSFCTYISYTMQRMLHKHITESVRDVVIKAYLKDVFDAKLLTNTNIWTSCQPYPFILLTACGLVWSFLWWLVGLFK